MPGRFAHVKRASYIEHTCVTMPGRVAHVKRASYIEHTCVTSREYNILI